MLQHHLHINKHHATIRNNFCPQPTSTLSEFDCSDSQVSSYTMGVGVDLYGHVITLDERLDA